MSVTSRSVRRLRRGGVSVELDYDAAHVLLQCREHEHCDRMPLVDDELGMMLVRFFRDHQDCSPDATFEVEDRTTGRSA